MKKNFGVAILCAIFAVSLLSGCTANTRVKNFGGSMNIDLEKGRKLVNITWKEEELWILTVQMSDSDEARSYKFEEKSSLGMVEGTVNIQEHK